MENIIFEKSYPITAIDKSEVYRYGGVGEVTPEIEALVDECIDEIKKILEENK